MIATNKNSVLAPEKKSLLIVEDEIPVLNILEKKFTQDGFQVDTARNGREGLAVAQQHKPDLILLDIVMPEMDGMTMLNQMRAQAWGKNLPVIILTNLADADRAEEAGHEGVYDFLIKSNWELAQLVALVKKKLKVK